MTCFASTPISWPAPLSPEHADLRQSAGLLLEALRRSAALAEAAPSAPEAFDVAWGLLSRGVAKCVSEGKTSLMDAPIFSNRHIESAWLLLVDRISRGSSFKAEVVACARAMGSSFNWALVLRGSRRLRAELPRLPPAARQALLDAAGARDLAGR
ncbi:unnamed protein product, partial [Polarella glacialis]